MSGSTEWLDYALSMADGASRGGHDFMLVSNRLEGLSLDAEVEDRLRRIAAASPLLPDEDAPRATRGLYGELTRWLLEFMVAASYVRKEQGLAEDELSFAVGKWFSRLGEDLAVASRRRIAMSILVKGFLNEARPFLVACTTPEGIRMVEAPLLVRVEHGRYFVTDEAENYLYHFDSTIDEFASDYSLIAARMGRELDAKSYDKSSRTVKDMIARVGHVRRQMNTLVEETGHLGPDEQWERYEAIKQSVDAIRGHREVVQRYHEEVARIWESWSNQDAMDFARETRGDRLSDLRSLEEGLRVLSAVESWMYDEYGGLSDRCAEVTQHYLRSSIVASLFSLDDLVEEVARANLRGLDWLDGLLLPATKPEPRVHFVIPPLVTLDEMMRPPKVQTEATSLDYESLGDVVEDEAGVREDRTVRDLAHRFGSWIEAGGGSLADWFACQSADKTFADMHAHDLTRLIASLLVADEDAVSGNVATRDEAPLESFAHAGWIRQVLSHAADDLRVVVDKGDGVTSYEGVGEQTVVRGVVDDVRIEVARNA